MSKDSPKTTEGGRPEVGRVSVDFTQESNTLGTTSEWEQITIALEFQAGEKAGPFVTIKTEGWSVDDLSDLDALVKRAKKVLEQDANGKPT